LNLNDLTAQQQNVFNRLVLGESNKEIAVAVKCSDKTVQGHLKHIFGKLGVTSRTKLIANYYRGL
jgi:DNA-binding NarL/FixJ family response regulator